MVILELKWPHLLSCNKHHPLVWKSQLQLLKHLCNSFQVLQKKSYFHDKSKLQDL